MSDADANSNGYTDPHSNSGSDPNTDSDPNTVAAASGSEQPLSVHVIWERVFELAR